MKVLCVGHAIKEIITAGECLDAFLTGAGKAGVDVSGKFLVSDGGDGFMEAYESNRQCTRHTVACTGPLGDAIEADFLMDEENNTAIIESAQACGLTLVEPHRRNIMISGTAGLADLIAGAKAAGARRILIGLGGSATCDGGVGLLWRLAELTGKCLPCDNEYRIALDMSELSSPEIQDIREWLGEVEITACVDVDNPLLGERGAARTFAAQKGASPDEVEQLEALMGDWAPRVERSAGHELRDMPGTGAAGGLGFALAAIGAELEAGAASFCKLIGLEDQLSPDSIVVTAEGKFDGTSLAGKAPWQVATMARAKGAQAAIFCGIAEPDAVSAAKERGVDVKEFGSSLPAEERKEKSAALLADSFAQYLQSHRRELV